MNIYSREFQDFSQNAELSKLIFGIDSHQPQRDITTLGRQIAILTQAKDGLEWMCSKIASRIDSLAEQQKRMIEQRTPSSLLETSSVPCLELSPRISLSQVSSSINIETSSILKTNPILLPDEINLNSISSTNIQTSSLLTSESSSSLENSTSKMKKKLKQNRISIVGKEQRRVNLDKKLKRDKIWLKGVQNRERELVKIICQVFILLDKNKSLKKPKAQNLMNSTYKFLRNYDHLKSYYKIFEEYNKKQMFVIPTKIICKERTTELHKKNENLIFTSIEEIAELFMEKSMFDFPEVQNLYLTSLDHISHRWHLKKPFLKNFEKIIFYFQNIPTFSNTSVPEGIFQLLKSKQGHSSTTSSSSSSQSTSISASSSSQSSSLSSEMYNSSTDLSFDDLETNGKKVKRLKKRKKRTEKGQKDSTSRKKEKTKKLSSPLTALFPQTSSTVDRIAQSREHVLTNQQALPIPPENPPVQLEIAGNMHETGGADCEDEDVDILT